MSNYLRTGVLVAGLIALFAGIGFLIGGPQGPEPTRHGDWHYKGRCTDF